MKDDNAFWSPAFDEFGDELARVAQADSGSRPRRRRWVIALVGLSLVIAPAAVALTSDDGDDESFRVPAPGSPEALESGPDGRQPLSPPGVAPRRDPMDPDQRKPPLRAP